MAPGKWSKTPTSIVGLHAMVQERNVGSSNTIPPQSENTSGAAAKPQNETPHNQVTRGKTKGKGLDRYIKAYGKIPVHIPESKGRPVNRITSAKFSNELGIIARSIIPLGTISYKKLEDTEKNLIYECIKDRFDMIDDGPHVKRCIDTIVAGRFRDHVCRLHKKWKKMIEDGMSYAEACKNPPEGIVESDWVIRCGMWEDEEYQQKCANNAKNRAKNELNHVTGSMSYVVARNEMGNPNRVEFFGKCYGGSEMTDFKTESAKDIYLSMLSVKESYPDMVPDDIADTVLGKRSGRIPGLGFGPRPDKSNPLGASSKVREEELKSIVSTQQEQIQTQGDKIQSQHEQIQTQGEKIQSQQEQIQYQGDKIQRLEEMVIKLMEERNAST